MILVLGDHGMTPDGNHGGASDYETMAALFVHSSIALLPEERVSVESQSESSNSIHRQVNQIDLVPTLALLLGVPIPFANLGQLLPDLFLPLHPQLGPGNAHSGRRFGVQTDPSNSTAADVARFSLLATALRKNAWQVHRFLEVRTVVSFSVLILRMFI